MHVSAKTHAEVLFFIQTKKQFVFWTAGFSIGYFDLSGISSAIIALLPKG
jgi:hypothetical protein